MTWGSSPWGVFIWGVDSEYVRLPLSLFAAGDVLRRIVVAEVEVSNTYAEIPTLTASIPRTIGGRNGATVDQVADIDDIRMVEYDGIRYRVASVDDDLEGPVSLSAEHLVVELGNLRSTYGPLPYDYLATPTYLLADIFATTRTHLVPGGRFLNIEPGTERPEGFQLLNATSGAIIDWPAGGPYATIGWAWQADKGRGNCLYGETGLAAPPIVSSEVFPVVAGETYSVSVDCKTTSSPGAGDLDIHIQSVLPDGDPTSSGVGPVTTAAVPLYSSSWLSTLGGTVTAYTSLMRVWFTHANLTRVTLLHNVRCSQLGLTSSGWTGVSELDTRTTTERQILVSGHGFAYDSDLWTLTSEYLTCTTTVEPILFETPPSTELTFHFGPSQSSSVYIIVNNKVVHNAPVAANATVAITGLESVSPTHRVRIHKMPGVDTLQLGTTSTGLMCTLGATRYVHISSDGSLLDALGAIQAQTGGGYEVDTATRTVTLKTIGADLRTTNVLELRLGANLIDVSESLDYTSIENSLMLSGADDLAYSLPYTATAEGIASQAQHGECWAPVDFPEITSLSSLIAAGKRWQTLRAPATATYTATVEETTAGYISIGDTVRLVAGRIDVSGLRVLAMEESSEGDPVRLTLGTRRAEALDELRRAL